MSDKDDSDDDGSNHAVSVRGITTSLINLSIREDSGIPDSTIVLEDNEDDVFDREDTDGYKLLHEANQRKLAQKLNQKKVSVEMLEEYDILKKKESRNNQFSNNEYTKEASKVCTLNTCTLEANEYMLRCKLCKRLTHYSCTKLPAYQVSLFTQKSKTNNNKSYPLYRCKDCVLEINSDILNNCQQEPDDNEFTMLSIKCARLEAELKEKIAIIESLENANPIKESIELVRVESRGTQVSSQVQVESKHTQVSNPPIYEAKTKTALDFATQELARVKDEKCQQKHENLKLKNKLKDLENKSEEDQKIIKSQDSQLDNLKKKYQKVQESSATNDASQSIDTKLENLSNNILTKVTNIIDEKLRLVGNQVINLETIPEKIDQNYKSFKDVLTKNKTENTIKNIRQVIQEDRNEKLIQEKERKVRAANIIIHGVKEVDNNDEKQGKDEHFFGSLLEQIGVEGKWTSIVRLGKLDDDKIRPMKVTLESEKLKDLFMKRLPNLKNAEQQDFKKISITDDYTVSERNEIRSWVEKAKEKNRDESGQYVWKVRGSPKNGMRLVKFTKQ